MAAITSRPCLKYTEKREKETHQYRNLSRTSRYSRRREIADQLTSPKLHWTCITPPSLMCQRFVVQSVGTKFTYLLYSLTESSTGYWQTLTPRIEGNINIVGYVVETEQLVGRIYLFGEDLQIPTGMSTGIWTCRRAKIFISSLIKIWQLWQ